MKPLALTLAFLLGLAAVAGAVASRSDMYVLSTDTGFQNRVRASLIAAAVAITTEGWAVAFHEQRMRQAVRILIAPASYAPLFANAAATDVNVIADATAAGTVILSAGNVATQAALVTDVHIDGAVSSQYNSLLVPLQNP